MQGTTLFLSGRSYSESAAGCSNDLFFPLVPVLPVEQYFAVQGTGGSNRKNEQSLLNREKRQRVTQNSRYQRKNRENRGNNSEELTKNRERTAKNRAYEEPHPLHDTDYCSTWPNPQEDFPIGAEFLIAVDYGSFVQ